MKKRVFKHRELEVGLEESQILLDVILGIVLGFAVMKLPEVIYKLYIEYSHENLWPLLLLMSAFIFVAFYWLETRNFMTSQKEFSEILRDEKSSNSVVLPLHTFFLGSLMMIALGAAILHYACTSYLAFLIVNMIFWATDLGGTLHLKVLYFPLRDLIEQVASEHRDIYAWFYGHIISSFFYLYGAVNLSIFAALIIIDVFVQSPRIRVISSIFILTITLFRHLYWRSRLFVWFVERKLRTFSIIKNQ